MVINVLEYLENSAKSMPQKNAFVDEYSSISYVNLLSRAKKIVSNLIQP